MPRRPLGQYLVHPRVFALHPAPGATCALHPAPGATCALHPAPGATCALHPAPGATCALHPAPGATCVLVHAPPHVLHPEVQHRQQSPHTPHHAVHPSRVPCVLAHATHHVLHPEVQHPQQRPQLRTGVQGSHRLGHEVHTGGAERGLQCGEGGGTDGSMCTRVAV